MTESAPMLIELVSEAAAAADDAVSTFFSESDSELEQAVKAIEAMAKTAIAPLIRRDVDIINYFPFRELRRATKKIETIASAINVIPPAAKVTVELSPSEVVGFNSLSAETSLEPFSCEGST